MARPVRYTFILVLVAVSTAIAAVGGWRYARASAPVSGPIVLISVDSLRADRLSLYGGTTASTPAIDALGADGVVFDRAYSHSPQTLPAHASMLSGRLPFRTGVRDNVGFTIREDERMLAEVLRDRGYATAGIVSSYALREDTGIGQGFTFFDGELTEDPSAAVGPLRRDGAEAQQIAEHWLASARTDRAFLFLHLSEPHKLYTRVEPNVGGALYDGAVAYADEVIGGLVHYLKSHQLYDQSTIILVSDHGEGLGDHGEEEHGLFLYEEAVHVPLVIKPAASDGGGRRVKDVVQIVDLMPTIADLARAPLPDDLDGRSLKSVLDGSASLPPRLVYAESLYGHYHFGWSPLASVADGRYRYVRAPREELYDLESDPREQTNVYAELPEQAARLRAALNQFDAGQVLPAQAEVDPEARRRLEALGYVGNYRNVTAPAGALSPDPKDKVAVLEAYREAMALSTSRQWFKAIEILRAVLREEPESADLWRQLAATATLAGRYDRAVDAYRRAAALEPDDWSASLGAAAAFLELGRLADARAEAEGVVASTEGRDAGVLADAHELLARIALARRDPVAARTHAALAQQAVSGAPLAEYVEGRLLFDRKRFNEALPLFQEAVARLTLPGARQVADLRFHTAETLAFLGRYDEAEREFLEELVHFPENTRARAGLATLYHSTDRPDEAAQVLTDLILLDPTPETYSRAARLWVAFGNPKQAAAIRADGARAFAPPPAPVPRAVHD